MTSFFLNAPRITAAGSHALLFEAEGTLTLSTQERVWKLCHVVSRWVNVADVQPGMNNLLIQFQKADFDEVELTAALQAAWESIQPGFVPKRTLEVGVHYGGPFGPDLHFLAQYHSLTIDEVIELHVAPVYTIFAPGVGLQFGYLFGLDPRLATPRRRSPEARPRNFTIMIAGVQCNIGKPPHPEQPVQVTGWHAIGYAPDIPRPFDLSRSPPNLFELGDKVKFYVQRVDR